MTRRTLLIGAGAGAIGVLLAACTPEPTPTRTPTSTPKPEPTGDTTMPAAFARSAWSTDPFALGAASFTPAGVQQVSREVLAAPVDGRVFIAGEATDLEAPGTLIGAYRSGDRAASDALRAGTTGERVAVIGAGLAGAVAVSALVAGGVEVTVFEARDRIGGRVHSVVDDANWPVPAQLGGWLMDAADIDLALALNDLDVRTAVIAGDLWRGSDGDVDAVSPEPVQTAVAQAQQQNADSSIEDALIAAGADPAEPGLAALLASISAASGSDPAQASSWFPPALATAERTAPLGDLNPLMEGLLEGAKVSLASPVSRVAYDENGVSLAIATGESLSFDRVVVTVPLGVLQSDGLQFSPALPFGHRGAIADLAMGFIETMWLRFDEPLPASLPEGDADPETVPTLWHIVGGDVVIRTWVNLRPVTGENIVVGIVGGDEASAFGELDDQDALAAALSSLKPFLSSAS